MIVPGAGIPERSGRVGPVAGLFTTGSFWTPGFAGPAAGFADGG